MATKTTTTTTTVATPPKKCERRRLPNELLSELVDWLPMIQFIGEHAICMRNVAMSAYLDRVRHKYEKAQTRTMEPQLKLLQILHKCNAEEKKAVLAAALLGAFNEEQTAIWDGCSEDQSIALVAILFAGYTEEQKKAAVAAALAKATEIGVSVVSDNEQHPAATDQVGMAPNPSNAQPPPPIGMAPNPSNAQPPPPMETSSSSSAANPAGPVLPFLLPAPPPINFTNNYFAELLRNAIHQYAPGFLPHPTIFAIPQLQSTVPSSSGVVPSLTSSMLVPTTTPTTQTQDLVYAVFDGQQGEPDPFQKSMLVSELKKFLVDNQRTDISLDQLELQVYKVGGQTLRKMENSKTLEHYKLSTDPANPTAIYVRMVGWCRGKK